MTRGETSILASGLADLRERQAVTETKLDSATEAIKVLGEKLDTIIEGQEKGRTDRAELRTAVESLQVDVKAMKPDVETVKDAKKVLKVAAWIAGCISIAVSTAWATWSWLVERITLR